MLTAHTGLHKPIAVRLWELIHCQVIIVLLICHSYNIIAVVLIGAEPLITVLHSVNVIYVCMYIYIYIYMVRRSHSVYMLF